MQIFCKKLLMANRDPYPPNTVLIENTTGSINLKKGVYKLEIVGSGGAGGNYVSVPNNYGKMSAGGGSGGAFIGELFLPKGTYTHSVGGNSVFNDIVAGAGGNAGSNNVVCWAGGGGGVTANSPTIISTIGKSNGVAGAVLAGYWGAGGGGSVYNGYGRGGNSYEGNPAGLLKLTYLRLKP